LWRSDLGDCGEDVVQDAVKVVLWRLVVTGQLLLNRDLGAARRVPRCWKPGGAEVAKGSGELSSKVVIFFGEFACAFVGGLESSEERCIGCALPRGQGLDR